MLYLIRLRVFLLCCLLMIIVNVTLIMGGFVAAGSAFDETGSLSGCDPPYMP